MKKLIMIAIVLAIATPAMALKYPDDPPPWRPCCCCYGMPCICGMPTSGIVFWEFEDDYCMPTSDVSDPAYYYDLEAAVEPPTFGSRHWDDPTEDSGWGCSYGAPCWTWSDGIFTVRAEDSFNQPIPEREDKQYLTQYFQVVHTMPEGLEEDDPRWPIGFGLELWDMTVLGWTGCPQGYENLPGDGYLNGYDCPEPDQHYELGDGWWKSIWVSKFSTDGSYYSGEYEEKFPELYDATHTACIVGMDFDYPSQAFQIEEVVVDFVWHDTPQVPECSCPPPPCWGIVVDTNDIPIIYEPQDAGGPPPEGPTEGQFLVNFAWRPGYPNYPPFTAKVVINPDPNNEVTPNVDFTFPASTEPNGVVRLIFTETNWDVCQTVVVKATEDILKEGVEGHRIDFTVTIDIADPNFEGCHRTEGIVVVDNDIPYLLVLPADPCKPLEGTLSENNPGEPACINVTLSHQPTDNVEILVDRESDFEILLESMSVMDPNHLLFTPGNYNVPQQICLEARDDDELAEAWLEWVSGQIFLNGFSDDLRYQSADEGGELEEVVVNFNVQDNECGVWGYMHADVNEDCYVNLGDVALVYARWLICTQSYVDGCDKLWNLLEEE